MPRLAAQLVLEPIGRAKWRRPNAEGRFQGSPTVKSQTGCMLAHPVPSAGNRPNPLPGGDDGLMGIRPISAATGCIGCPVGMVSPASSQSHSAAMAATKPNACHPEPGNGAVTPRVR